METKKINPTVNTQIYHNFKVFAISSNLTINDAINKAMEHYVKTVNSIKKEGNKNV